MQSLMEGEFGLLLEAYLEDTPKLLTTIEAATTSMPVDLQGLAAAAHQLKSSSASFGFTELAELAASLERIGHAGVPADTPELTQQACDSFSQLQPWLAIQVA
jgi:HPt (histidine-containing phosphotransfer) domain-containing protein